MFRAKLQVQIVLFVALVLLPLTGSAAALSPEIKPGSGASPEPGGALVASKKPASGKEKLAVLDLDRSGVESELAFSMSVVLRDELFALGDYEVLSREDLMALAKRLSIQQQAGDECADDQCLVSYGRSLGTRYMVAGVLSKVGNTYSVSLRLLDTEGETGGVMNRVYERCKCSQDELFDAVAAAAAKLMSKMTPTTVAAVPVAPVPPVAPPEPSLPPALPAPLAIILPVSPSLPGALPAPSAPSALIARGAPVAPVLPALPAALPAPPAPQSPVMPVATAPAVAPVLGGNFTDSVSGMEFVPVPGGCFQMGDVFGDGKSDERPVHEVCLDAFSIGKYEVTQGQWQKVMGKNPSRYQKGDNYPVENVRWEDTQAFIAKLNQKSGRNYRLPTEAEWEYAARSGGKREKYAGGDEVEELAWYEDNSGFSPRAVGGKSANGLGIYDMSGNVWEWCADWRDSDYYAASPRNNPGGPASASYHAVRGGAWSDTSFQARTTNRFRGVPVRNDLHDSRTFSLGLRLALPQSK